MLAVTGTCGVSFQDEGPGSGHRLALAAGPGAVLRFGLSPPGPGVWQGAGRAWATTNRNPAMSPLFRPESLRARAFSWLGRPLVLSPIPGIAFAVFALVFVALATALLAFGDYTRRVRVTGVILPQEGLTRILAPQTGWISELRVGEGDKVARGDILYALGVDITTALGATQGTVTEILHDTRAELLAAMARAAQMRAQEKRGLLTRIADLERELPLIGEQLALAGETTGEYALMADRQKDMLRRGMAVSAEYEQRLRAWHAERAQIPRLRREQVQSEARLHDLRAELAGHDFRVQAELGELRRQILDIDQRISEGEARRELAVTAPRDGTVTGILALAGQTVTAGAPMLTIVPDDQPLVAQLLAPGEAIGFVREDMPVLLRYSAFPYQKFGQYPGAVAMISRASLGPEGLGEIRPGPDAAALYRITVAPETPFVNAYGRQEPLQAGMEVEAHLMVETRPLYQWILEPVYGLRGAISSGS